MTASMTLARELRGALLGVLSGRLDVDSLALSVYTVDVHARQLAREVGIKPAAKAGASR